MLHKCLRTYELNRPVKEGQAHPDGPLWLMTTEEFEDLPKGIWVEDKKGNIYRKGYDKISPMSMYYGIRGK